jgi:hypothetical protein
MQNHDSNWKGTVWRVWGNYQTKGEDKTLHLTWDWIQTLNCWIHVHFLFTVLYAAFVYNKMWKYSGYKNDLLYFLYTAATRFLSSMHSHFTTTYMYKWPQLTISPHTDSVPTPLVYSRVIVTLLLLFIIFYLSLFGKYFLNSSWTALLVKGL